MENLNLNLSVLNRLNVKKTGKHCEQWGVYAFRLIFFDYIYVLLLFKDSCTSVDFQNHTFQRKLVCIC